MVYVCGLDCSQQQHVASVHKHGECAGVVGGDSRQHSSGSAGTAATSTAHRLPSSNIIHAHVHNIEQHVQLGGNGCWGWGWRRGQQQQRQQQAPHAGKAQP